MEGHSHPFLHYCDGPGLLREKGHPAGKEGGKSGTDWDRRGKCNVSNPASSRKQEEYQTTCAAAEKTAEDDSGQTGADLCAISP